MSVIAFSYSNNLISQLLYYAQIISNNKLQIIGVTQGEIKNSVGYDKLYKVNSIINNDSWAYLLNEIFKKENGKFVIAPHSKNNVDILARFSAISFIPMLTNVNLEIKDGNLLAIRKIFGGKALSYTIINEKVALTVQTKRINFKLREVRPEIIEIKEFKESKITRKEIKIKEKSKTNLENAKIVIGVGRGFGKKEDLNLAFELAKLINGEVGCTRPIAADFKWMPEDSWIGISSKSIRPKLYIAIGISGAPQHVAGIIDSEIIIAINKDKNALISKYTDYFIVADLYEFIPKLINKLKNLKIKQN